MIDRGSGGFVGIYLPKLGGVGSHLGSVGHSYPLFPVTVVRIAGEAGMIVYKVEFR